MDKWIAILLISFCSYAKSAEMIFSVQSNDGLGLYRSLVTGWLAVDFENLTARGTFHVPEYYGLSYAFSPDITGYPVYSPPTPQSVTFNESTGLFTMLSFAQPSFPGECTRIGCPATAAGPLFLSLIFNSDKTGFVSSLPLENYHTQFSGPLYFELHSLSRISSIPIPAAAWLFGSSLLGLTGFARQRKAT
jgi:hypothetical protein